MRSLMVVAVEAGGPTGQAFWIGPGCTLARGRFLGLCFGSSAHRRGFRCGLWRRAGGERLRRQTGGLLDLGAGGEAGEAVEDGRVGLGGECPRAAARRAMRRWTGENE